MTSVDKNEYQLTIVADETSNAEAFLSELRVATESEGMLLQIDEYAVVASVIDGDVSDVDSWKADIESADVVVFVLRHIDVISLERAKKIYQALPSGSVVPFTVLILRKDGEGDFKMSCPTCAQKLWVRDSDVDKRGRCPNCKKAFTLPSQVVQLRAALKLPDAATVSTVYEESPASCLSAVQNLLGSLQGELRFQELAKTEGSNAQTVRVQVQGEE